MSLCCIYHKTYPMQVMEEDEADKLVASGEWFRHPNDVTKGDNHEKHVQCSTRKRSVNGKSTSEENGV